MTSIEQVTVRPDLAARVLIDDNNGVITITSKAQIMPVALTHGSFTIKVTETPNVYMPNVQVDPLSPYGYGNQGYMNQTIVQNPSPNSPSPSDLIQALGDKHKSASDLLKQQHDEQVKLFNQMYPESLRTNDQTKQLEEMRLAYQQQVADLTSQQKEEVNKLVLNQQQPSQNGSVLPPLSPVVTDNTQIRVKEEKGKFTILRSGADLQEFVNALNALGATPKDMMAILQNIKAAGALQAEIIQA